jgi:uncharacterized protein
VPRHPFLVHVAKLRQELGSSRHEVLSGTIDDLVCVGSEVPPEACIEADVTLTSMLGGIEVTGTVTAPWSGECRRCLEGASGTMSLAVRELYTDDGDGEDTYPLRDGDLDLEPLVRDAVLLELPLVPLCRPDCLGLCPRCGANRNEEPCSCTEEGDPRWAALDVLRVPDGGSPSTGYRGPAPDPR